MKNAINQFYSKFCKKNENNKKSNILNNTINFKTINRNPINNKSLKKSVIKNKENKDTLKFTSNKKIKRNMSSMPINKNLETINIEENKDKKILILTNQSPSTPANIRLLYNRKNINESEININKRYFENKNSLRKSINKKGKVKSISCSKYITTSSI